MKTNSFSQQWMTEDELRSLGFSSQAPEVDFGMRWGEDGHVRVSFAPGVDGTRGYLYAHDRRKNLTLLLARDVSIEEVDSTWRTLLHDV